ncbi:MAG: hypothetical protein H0U34_09730 [Sphingomonas sp.]|nr:hypothetical protein [Sphingomonas sp.]
MNKLLIVGAAGLVAAMGFATVAAAADPKSRSVPKGWNYDIKDGKRVSKANRQANADGSWREEVRQGKCVTVKEKSATGEYKESRRCS